MDEMKIINEGALAFVKDKQNPYPVDSKEYILFNKGYLEEESISNSLEFDCE